MFEKEEDEVNDLSTDELQMEDPIDQIIEEVGEKYKETWEELSK